MDMEQYFNQHQVHLCILASLISFGVTQVVKPFWVKAKSVSKEQGAALTRLCAIISGGVVGYSLSSDVAEMWLGAGMGAVNAIVMALARKRLGIEQPQADDPAKDGDNPQS